MIRTIKTVLILGFLLIWFTFPLWIGVPLAMYLRLHHPLVQVMPIPDYQGLMVFIVATLCALLLWVTVFGWKQFFTPLGEYLVKSARALTADPPPPPMPQLPHAGALWETDETGKVLKMRKKQTSDV